MTCHRGEQRNERSPRASHGLHVDIDQFLSRLSRSCHQGEGQKQAKQEIAGTGKVARQRKIGGPRGLPTCPFSIVFRLIARRLKGCLESRGVPNGQNDNPF
jgi:hypothetical protein